jgi:hypothetical protein
MDYTITITETEKKCLEYAVADVDEWITNAAKARAMTAKEDIIAILVKYCNENDIVLAVGEDAQITQAYELEVVKTVAQLNAEMTAELEG